MDGQDLTNRQTAYFKDRLQAGSYLAGVMKDFSGSNPLVLALPRGGVAVGYEIARRLHMPLNVIVARKIGAPANPELGIGAVSEQGVLVLDAQALRFFGLSRNGIGEVIEREKEEVKRRIGIYRRGKPLPPLHHRTAIIVDDGLATGVTAEAAVLAVKKMQPQRIIVAVPVCAYETLKAIREQVDDLICLSAPFQLRAIGLYYRNFREVSDRDVIGLLHRSRYRKYHRPAASP